MSEQPSVGDRMNDHDLGKLEEIRVRDLRYLVMPRYLNHYVVNEYEPFSSQYWTTYIRPDDLVVDVGAHYGYYTLLAARAAFRGRVFAFEPVPTNAAVLERNIALNGFSNVTVSSAAVSDAQGTRQFNVTEASDSGGFYAHPLSAARQTIEVVTDTLDQALGDLRIDWLKIDTEGHELSVLAGARELIERNPQMRMIVELNPRCLARASRTPAELVDELARLGFVSFLIDEERRVTHQLSGRFDPWPGFLNERGYANILAIRRTRTAMVLMVSHTANQAGAEDALMDLAVGLQERGMVCQIVLPARGPMMEVLAERAISTHVIPFGWWARSHDGTPPGPEVAADNARAIGELCGLAENIGADRVLTNTMVIPWGAIAAAKLGLPHLLMVHEFGDLDHGLLFTLGFGKSLRLLGILSDAVVVNSQAVADHIREHIPRGRMSVTYYFTDAPERSASEGVEMSGTASLRLVLVGRVTRSKGQLEAVEAIRLLSEQGYSGVELSLVGQAEDPDYLGAIQSIIERHNLHNVKVLGHRPNPHAYMSAADAVLVCSAMEAFGRVTLEAMALGKPIVAANTGGTLELLQDGKTGLLYRSGDPADLAAKIAYLHDHRERAQSLGAEARTDASDRFSEERFCGPIYAQLLGLTLDQDPLRQLTGQLVELVIQPVSDYLETTHFENLRLEQELEPVRHRLLEIERSRTWRMAEYIWRVKARLRSKN